MKKPIRIFYLMIITLVFAFVACNSKKTEEPCNNTGTLCIENKMDSTITVNIVQKHQQVPMKKDYMECFVLEANIAYTISISGSGYSKPDTTLLILACDNKLMVVKQ
jgi:hypothetical protein